MQPEVIKSIEEFEGKKFDGYKIHTTDQVITLSIENFQSCCENWGHFMTNDNPSEFIGAEVLGVVLVDECLIADKAPDLYEGGVMYVNIETNKGTLQFTAYNDHNGYYGHEAKVECKQLNHNDYL